MSAVKEIRSIDVSAGYEKPYIVKKNQLKKVLTKAVIYVLLSICGLTMIVPLLWMLSTSLKEPGSVMNYPPQWIPTPVVWKNYIDAWNAMPFGQFYWNSIYVGIMVTAGQVITSSMAAYAFARLKFPGRDKIFFAYLATMMIPGSVTMIPVFI